MISTFLIGLSLLDRPLSFQTKHPLPVKQDIAWSTAQPVPDQGIQKESFRWNRPVGVGLTVDGASRYDTIMTTYGGNKKSSSTPVNIFRFTIKDSRPAPDNFSSAEWLVLIWSATSNMAARLRGEPGAQWVMQDISAVGLFKLATGEHTLGGLIPFWRLYQPGNWIPDQTFTISEPIGLTDTKNSTLRYLGVQKVMGIPCGLFEYTSTMNTMGNNVRNGPHGKLWVDPRDGIWRLVIEDDPGEFIDHATGASGNGVQTTTIWRYKR